MDISSYTPDYQKLKVCMSPYSHVCAGRKRLKYGRLECANVISFRGVIPSVHVNIVSLIHIFQPFKEYFHKSVLNKTHVSIFIFKA